MTISKHITATLELPNMVVSSYLEDLTDDELFVRPISTMNHIAWQLGHLIAGENFHINQICSKSMPPLPEGFADNYTKETAPSDDRSIFLPKADYLRLMNEQREGTLSVLERLSDADLSKPSPESMQYFGSTVGAVIAGEATHWMMHAGQWAVVRRRLGKPPLF